MNLKLGGNTVTLFERVFGGNDYNYARTVAAIDEAIAAYGESEPVSFPGTAYSLPCYYGVTGVKITTLGEMKAAMDTIKSKMTRNNRLHDAFESGIASALCAEFLEALKYLHGAEPYAEPEMGHLTDAFVRNLGVPLVTGDIPGVAVIIGGAEDPAETVALAKSYQAQGILVTLTGDSIKHCFDAGMKLGENVRVVPLGYEMQSVIHVVSVAVRAALIFGNVTPGDFASLAKYTMDRVKAFVNAYKPLSDEIVSYGAGAICLGFPVISNETENMFRVPKSLIQQLDTSKWNATSLEARDIKLKITNIDIPVAFATAFEGEIIRRGDMQVEVDGSRVDCFELVQTRDASEVEDHKIVVDGPEIDEIPVGSKISLSYTVEVAGKAMQPDFESVMERKFHSYLNCIEGVMHTGQRDMIRIRISKADFEAGFKFRHIGEVLYAKVKSEFEAVVDKCQVTIVVDAEKNKELRAAANAVFNKHDILVVILDNGTTAMTGHQPNPGMLQDILGEEAMHLDIESVVRGLGVTECVKVRSYNLKALHSALEDMRDKKGVRVIIAEEPCVLYARRRLKKAAVQVAYVAEQGADAQRCLEELACPAFYRNGEDVAVDENLCTGCMVCLQVAPKAFKARKRA